MSAWTRGAVLSGLLLLAGCGDEAVEIPPVADPAHLEACTTLAAHLPDTLGGAPRRSEVPADAPGAAWGDPPIVLACGVPPLDGPLTCQDVGGVEWYVPEDQMADQSLDVVATTIGLQPAAELRIPASYRPPLDVLVDLAAPLRKHLTQVEGCL